ncbi:MAG: hypothetical protein A4E23_01682 [Methanomethylovorans sp. PtaU1.Bin073]|nr:MAG: hypothetical protein A4E23_01682 [Methanomethylovorans sp. PtaU1.Bin073]
MGYVSLYLALISSLWAPAQIAKKDMFLVWLSVSSWSGHS